VVSKFKLTALVATLLIVVAVVGVVAGAYIVKSENISLDLSGLSGILELLQGQTVVTTVVTTVVSGQVTSVITSVVTPSALGPGGASCQIMVSDTDINAGDNIGGQLTSNRVGIEVNIFHRLMGEAMNPNPIVGITNAQGSWIAFSGTIDQLGIYQLAAALNFPAQGVMVACTPIITVTVHGLRISVNPDSIPKAVLSDIIIDVYSDHPNSVIAVQDQTSVLPVWALTTSVTTNAGGHGTVTLHVITGSDWWNFRALDPVDSSPSANEEWLTVT